MSDKLSLFGCFQNLKFNSILPLYVSTDVMRAPCDVSRVSRCVRDRGLSSTGCNRSVTLGVTTQTPEPGPGLGAHYTWQNARRRIRDLTSRANMCDYQWISILHPFIPSYKRLCLSVGKSQALGCKLHYIDF